MALTTEREKRICAKYSAKDEYGNVHCNVCPLHTKYDMPSLRCKALMHYDRHRREWVDDEEEVKT